MTDVTNKEEAMRCVSAVSEALNPIAQEFEAAHMLAAVGSIAGAAMGQYAAEITMSEADAETLITEYIGTFRAVCFDAYKYKMSGEG